MSALQRKTDPGELQPDAQSLGETPSAIAITHFNFEHGVFKTPGACFLPIGLKREPTFRVDMGDLEGLISLQALRATFQIKPDSHDAKLIELAVAGLHHVPDIKPGDEIPSEILTGKASWTVRPKHKKIAEQRLQVQLLSWVSGKEILLTDPAEIEMFLQQIENREKLRSAFRDAAKALGHEPENVEPVIKHLELLARELCYIEALRDRFALTNKLDATLAELGKSYGNDRMGKMELNRVHNLLHVGMSNYRAMFAQADAQTGEIIAALKSIDRQIKFIRRMRDDLHFLLMQWEPYIVDLDGWTSRRSPETDKRLASLYRFLATVFTSGRSMLKRRDEQEKAAKAGAAKKADPNSKPIPKSQKQTVTKGV